MCKLSIIVPVYNVEAYLEDCLASIERQTNRDFEVILVNDGSTDKSGEIAKKYKQAWDNVKYIKQKNLGLSEARNTGLKHAEGEYILFIDSDDWIESNTVEILSDSMIDKPEVILFAGRKKFESDKDRCEHFGPAHALQGIKKGLEVFCFLRENKEYSTCVCLQCVKREFLECNKIKFYPGILHEDHLYTFEALVKANSVLVLTKEFYNYRIRDNSIMTTNGRYYERYVSWVKIFSELIKISNSNRSYRNNKIIHDYIMWSGEYALRLYYEVDDKLLVKKKQYLMELKKQFKLFFGLNDYIHLISIYISIYYHEIIKRLK